jgi:3-oxoacyl-[acyl-carrier protein] reductase
MDLGLRGRVALVTGARRGIGAAIVRELAAEGCDLVLVDAVADGQLAEVAADVERSGGRVLQLVADVRDYGRAEEVVATAVAELGRLDAVVCSAGITRDGVSWKLDETAWDDVLAVNLKGCFTYARAAGAHFRRLEAGGRIVGVSSINGLRGKVGQAAYAASKAGMVGLIKTLARELGRWGVTANAVAPGLVSTDMTRALPAEVRAAAEAEAVLATLATPASVAALVAFLCSDRAAHITGEVIRVDAGQYI